VVVISSPKLVPGAHPDQVLYDLTHNPGYVAMGEVDPCPHNGVRRRCDYLDEETTHHSKEGLLQTPASDVKPSKNEILKIVFLKEGK
jgi:hypothetical protein